MSVFAIFLVGFVVVVISDLLVSALGRGIGREVGEAIERALSGRH